MDKDTLLKGESTTLEFKEALSDNPNITLKELAFLTGLSVDGVRWNLSKLKEENKIERIGGNRSGYWLVKERGE